MAPTHLDWAASNGIIEPSSAKKAAGWASGEKPAFQYFNWLSNEQDKWNKYFDAFTMRDGAYNFGLTLAAGVISITQADGTAFANVDGDRGFVVMPSQATPGEKVILAMTANQTIQDATHGTPQILGRYGTTTSVAWADFMPWFIHFINKDDTDAGLRASLTRNPCMALSPSDANNIGIAGTAPVTSSEHSIILFGTGVATGYTSKPSILSGCLLMTCDASAGGSWTVDSLDEYSGFGEVPLVAVFGAQWELPAGQNGAAASSYFTNNGGTAPQFTANESWYIVNRNGTITTDCYFNGDTGNDGSGAVQSEMALPAMVFREEPTSNAYQIPSGTALGATTITGGTVVVFSFDDVSRVAAMSYQSSATAISAITNAMFSNGNRQVTAAFTYRAFTSTP